MRGFCGTSVRFAFLSLIETRIPLDCAMLPTDLARTELSYNQPSGARGDDGCEREASPPQPGKVPPARSLSETRNC